MPIPESPCICYLEVHPNVIEIAATTLASNPPATITYLSTFGRLTKAVHDSLLSRELEGEEFKSIKSYEELNNLIEGSYKVLFGLIKNCLKDLKPHDENVLNLIKSQGGFWTYEMARKYRRAISIGISVRDPQWRKFFFANLLTVDDTNISFNLFSTQMLGNCYHETFRT